MLNRAFLVDYWRRARWILPVMGLFLITTLFIPTQQLAQKQQISGISSFPGDGAVDWLSLVLWRFDQVPWLMIALALLGTVLFHDDRRAAGSDLMFSLPVTRQEIYFTKWITGIGIIGMIFLSFFVMIGVNYLLYSSWTVTSYWVILQFSVLAGVAYAAAYTLMMLVQAAMGNALKAGLITGLAPIGFSTVMTLTVNSVWFNTGLPYDHPLISWLMRLKYFRFRELYVPDMLTNVENGRAVALYGHWLANVLILAAVIWLAYRLGCLAYTHNRAEDNGKLVLFPQLLPLVKWSGALVFGLAIAYALARPALWHNVLRLDLLFVLASAMGYLIMTKAMRRLG